MPSEYDNNSTGSFTYKPEEPTVPKDLFDSPIIIPDMNAVNFNESSEIESHKNRILKETVILSCFRGIGKTFTYKYTDISCIDLDSSSFNYIGDRSYNHVNPLFPKNYISKIIELKDKNIYDFIFVSSHDKVREVLRSIGINFITVYPHGLDKDYYIENNLRSRHTGLKDDEFIKLIESNWEKWIPYPPATYNRKYIDENIIWLFRLPLSELCRIMPYILARYKNEKCIQCIEYGDLPTDEDELKRIHYDGCVDEMGNVVNTTII